MEKEVGNFLKKSEDLIEDLNDEEINKITIFAEEDVKYFIGIDVAKDSLAVFFSETNKYIEIPNDENSLKECFKDIKKRESLVVLETTGGYEDICINWLYMNGFKIFRVNTKKFKYFKSDWEKMQRQTKSMRKCWPHTASTC